MTCFYYLSMHRLIVFPQYAGDICLSDEISAFVQHALWPFQVHFVWPSHLNAQPTLLWSPGANGLDCVFEKGLDQRS